MRPLTIRRFRLRPASSARCADCDTLRPQATRERCRRHALQFGHRVRYVIEDVTDYAPAAGETQ
jgi:hypothetical protein